jgi:O-antigen ligase
VSHIERPLANPSTPAGSANPITGRHLAALRRLPPRIPLVVAGLAAAVALTVSFVPPLAAGWLVFGAAAVALVLLRPIVALYLLPTAVAFGAEFSLIAMGVHIGPTDLLVGALALAWLVSQVRAWRAAGVPGVPAVGQLSACVRTAWRRDRVAVLLYAALLAYLLVVMASAAIAASRVTALKEALKWAEVAAMVPLTVWALRSLSQVRVVVWSTIAAGAAAALHGIAQWALDTSVGGSSRVFGTFDQPNPFAGFLNLALPLALALVLFGRDTRERWVAGTASVFLLVAEALADSRGAFLGLGAALIVLAVVGWRRERAAGWALAIGLPVVIVAWAAHLVPKSIQARVLDQVGSLHLDSAALCGNLNAANYSTLERLGHWVAGLRMFTAHPLLGVGAGNYDAAYAQYAPACFPNALGHAHNYYINAAAETGVLGLLAFLALTGAALAAGWRATHVRTAASHDTGALADQVSMARVFALGFFAAIVTLIAHNLTDNLFVHGMELQFALSLGALLWLRTFLVGATKTTATIAPDDSSQIPHDAPSAQGAHAHGVQSVLPAGDG